MNQSHNSHLHTGDNTSGAPPSSGATQNQHAGVSTFQAVTCIYIFRSTVEYKQEDCRNISTPTEELPKC